MAVTASQLQTRFSEFASLDPGVVEAAIAEAELQVSRTAWGEERADAGVLYLAAHILKLDAQGGDAPPGPITSERLMSWGATYAVPTTGSSEPEAVTAYGRRYLALRRGVFGARFRSYPTC
jgi:hypothetical protein